MVKIEKASYHYDDTKKQGLNEISLYIRKGECVLLCGESGCGKTTATRLLNGLIPNFYEGEFCGRIEIDGKDVTGMKPDDFATFVGSVFQNPRSQFFNLDTTSEIAFGCENMGMQPDEIYSRVQNAAKSLGISHLLDRDIFALSGGEKQLVALASVYALGPNIFVLDEPSSNLDAAACRELAKLIAKLKKMGKTIVIAEHRIYYIADLIDRAIYIENGHIKHEFTGDEFRSLTKEEISGLGLRAVSLEELLPSPLRLEPQEATLKIDKISVGYKRNKPVLDNFSLRASCGEVIGVIGKNGQGKSTFARMLCGLLRESGGSIELDGKKLSASKRTNLFYLVMQDSNYQLFTESVENELKLSENRKSVPSDEKVQKVMKELSLTQFYERHPMSLSGGQKQRLAIGVSMVRDAEVLIFDEPTSGLDFSNMQRVCGIIQDLQRQGKIIFIITHDYELLLSTCTRIVEIADGNVYRDLTLDENKAKTIQSVFLC